MEKIKKFVCRYFYIFIIPFVCFYGGTAYASGQTLPDLSADGSISVTMKEEKNNDPVPGGTLTLYQAAELQEEEGTLSWKYTENFENCGLVPEDISEEKFANLLKDYVDSYHIQGIEKEISSEGTLNFDDLTPGIYLIMQEDPAEGYYPINSFVVSVPTQGANGWSYHVDASPKMEQCKEIEIPPVREKSSPKAEESAETAIQREYLNGSPRTGRDDHLIFFAAVLCGAALTGGCVLAIKRRS